jgi:protoporphyrinogen oxidase
MPNVKEASIVGGGIMGMSLALNLVHKGYKVSIFEASPKPGGLVEPWNIGDISWDKFYHVILLSDLNTRRLIKELGLEEKLNWRETKTGFYTNGKLYSMSNTWEFLKFPPLRLVDKFRLGLTIYAASRIRNWKKLECQYVEDWLKKWSGKRTFDKIWLPLLRAKLGDLYKETSAAFIWATIQRMYAARRSGLKKEMFGYVDGGYQTIIHHLVDHLKKKGVNIYTSHRLQDLDSTPSQHKLIFDNGNTYSSPRVIFTVPSRIIPKLWSNMPSKERIQHQAIKYMGVSCTSMLLKKDISPYYVTNITDDHIPFTGIIEMSALVDKQSFNGHALVYLPKYVDPEDEIFQRPDEQIHQEFKTKILQMYPHLREDDIVVMKTAKAPMVFALNTINYSRHLPPIKSAVNGIYYANTAFITNGTLNVNQTIGIANKIANEYF